MAKQKSDKEIANECMIKITEVLKKHKCTMMVEYQMHTVMSRKMISGDITIKHIK